MKYKLIALAVLALIIYSCAAKSTVPTTEVKKPESTEPTVNDKKTVATMMTPELAEGQNLYENNCAKCHNLYNAKDFSAAEWKPIVDRMAKKAHLDDLQGQKIYNYLTMN